MEMWFYVEFIIGHCMTASICKYMYA